MSFVVCFVGCPFRLICIPSRDRIGWHPIDERQMTIRATHWCTCTWNWTESEPDIGHSSRDPLLHLTAAAVKVRPPDGTDCPFSPFTTIISVRYANFGQFSSDPMRANFFGIFFFFFLAETSDGVAWRPFLNEWMNRTGFTALSRPKVSPVAAESLSLLVAPTFPLFRSFHSHCADFRQLKTNSYLDFVSVQFQLQTYRSIALDFLYRLSFGSKKIGWNFDMQIGGNCRWNDENTKTKLL